MKRIFCLILTFVLIFSLCACGTNDVTTGEATKIKFSQPLDELKALEGKTVEMNGFMSMLSPLDGKLIYLMNIPLQSCPFCIPNTTTLSNTIAVTGKNLEYTSKPVKVVGTIEVGNFVDGYGYNYEFRIANATIVEMDEKELSETMKVYYSVTENDYVGDVYTMCMYIDEIAYHEDYGFATDEILKLGEIPYNRYDEIHSSITSLNKNGEYDDFLALLEKTNEIRLKINEDIRNKNVENFVSYQASSNELYELFTQFINKYEF